MNYQKEIIQLLKEDQWITAETLALRLNCSVRTIKKYVAEIKTENGQILSSSNKGYQLKENYKQLLAEPAREETPQTQKERINFILKELMLNRQNSLTVFDLTELLFVSESTVRKDLIKVKAFLEKKDCSLEIVNSTLQLNGNDQQIRAVITEIIRSESTGNFFDLANLTDFFPDYNISFIRETILKIITSHSLHITDVGLASLTRHVVISMYRIPGKQKTDTQAILRINDPGIRSITLEIIDFIAAEYNMTLDHSELRQLELLLYAKLYQSENSELLKEEKDSFSDQKIRDFGELVIRSVKEHFNLDLDHTTFLERFSLHLQALIFRSQNNLLATNPLTHSIKLQVPFIYDISVFISNLIHDYFHIAINDDEIAYIVFHLGSFLEENSEIDSRSELIHCTLLFPNLGFSNINYKQKITEAFSQQLTVDKVIESLNDFDISEKGQLLITSYQAENNYQHSVVVSPLITKQDQNKIQQEIDHIQHDLVSEKQTAVLLDVFSEKLFSLDTNFTDKWETIEYLCNQLIAENYVDSSYLEEVDKRERLSSTSFGHFAIPHSLNMVANKTGIAVLIQKNPIKWDQNKVHIVFLFAFSPENVKKYRDLFEQITNQLTEEEVINQISNCKSFTEFIQLLR